MNKSIPFYPNLQDNAHCAPAVFRSLIEFFCSDKLSWPEMDRLGHSVEGKGTWTTPYHLKLAECGVEVRVIESFDYEEFASKGQQYLKTLRDKGQYYIEKSNWEEVYPYVKEFLNSVHHENRNASIGEIDDLLEKGYLLGIELNSRVLNGREGFTLHYVLVKEKRGDQYLINDPGGLNDGFENRLVDREMLVKAIGGNHAQYEVAAFRKP